MIEQICLRSLNSLSRVVIGTVLLAICTLPAAAQRRTPVSVEFNVGAGFGSSSSAAYGPSRAVSADLLLGYRLRASASSGLVLALSGSTQASGVHVVCDIVPGGSCTRNFPNFWIASGLVGWETGNGQVRILAGPALALSGSEQAGAAQARLELAKPLAGRWSLLASGRLAYLPEHGGDAFTLGAVGIGLRVR